MSGRSASTRIYIIGIYTVWILRIIAYTSILASLTFCLQVLQTLQASRNLLILNLGQSVFAEMNRFPQACKVCKTCKIVRYL